MTVTSYAVGAEFKIVDGFTAPLAKLLAGVRDADFAVKKLQESAGGIAVAFDKSITKAAAALTALNDDAVKKAAALQGLFDKAFVGLGASADAGVSGVLTAFDRMDAAIASSVRSMDALKRSMAEMDGLAALPGGGGGTRLPGSGPFGRAKHSGGGGSGGAHFGRVGSELPGGTHISIGGNSLLAAAGIFGYGVYEEAEIQDQVARIMATSQLPFGKDMMQSPQAKMIRDAIQSGAASTGFSAKEVGESMLGTEREFQGLSFEKRMEVLKTLMPYAGAEARLKETGLKESFETLVGLMHMSGGFKPEDLPELARSFSFASMATPSSLPQFANALSYPMTTLHEGLGMDPSTVMFLTSMMQTAGIKSTKSGTWLRSFFQGAEPDTAALGPLTKSQQQHNEALRKLGLMDAEGHSTWQQKGADGKVDWTSSVIGMSETLNKNLHGIPTDDRLEIIKKAFGQQGGGFATLMEMNSFIEQMPVIADKMKSFKGGNDVLDMLGQGSTVQQAREAWRDTQNLLMDIGKTALPAVNGALKDFDNIIKSITDSPGFKLFVKATEAGTDPIAAAAAATRKAVTDGLDSLTKGGKPQSREEINRELRDKNYHPTAFIQGFGANDNLNPLAQAVRDGFLAAFQQMGAGGGPGIGGGGGGAGGGGFTNAAFTTFGASGGNFLPGAPGSAVDTAMRLQGLGSSGAASALGAHMTNGEWCADFVNGALAAHGIKGSGSSAALSFSRWGTAVGAMAAQKGDVAFENHGGGHGHAMLLTGEHDSRGWLGVVAGNSGGRVKHYWENPAKIAGIRRAVPSVGAPPSAGRVEEHHHHIHLDGKEIQASVTRRQKQIAMFPTSVGGMDTHGSFASPGTPLADAA